MEAVYEVRYTNNAGLLAEFYRRTVCGPYRAIGLVILCIAAFQLAVIASVMTGTLDLHFSAKTGVTILVMGIVELVIGILLCTYHRLMAHIAMKQGRKMHGDAMPETVIRLGDRIEVLEGESKSTFDFSQIVRIRSSRRMYCILFGRYSGIALPRDSFTGGDPETFIGWLRERAPQAR
ncbi:MAG: YcxB family protein [Anaerovoracaceae bacterium]|jgi:hypothetical protein